MKTPHDEQHADDKPEEKNQAEREDREKREAEGNPVFTRDRIVDPGLVIVQNTYRVGFMPPLKDSLTLGELFIELSDGKPKLWVGIQNTADLSSNIENIEVRIAEGIPGARFDPDKEVNRGPVSLVGASGEARDPPLPATPADALPTTQQHLAQQYRERDLEHPILGQEGEDQRAAYETPHPAHREPRRETHRAAQPQDHKPEQK